MLAVNPDLKMLRVLTESLSNSQPSPSCCCLRSQDLDGGTVLTWDLLDSKEIVCRRWFLSNGTRIRKRQRAHRELFVVYAGSLHFADGAGGVARRVRVGQELIIEPNVSHSIRCEEDCWALVVMVPRGEG